MLTDINLEVVDKEFLVILGSSGSGKSTLLKIIAGIETTDSGTIESAGQRIDTIPLQKRRIGYLYQEPLLFPHMNVRQNIVYSLVMAKKGRKEIEEKYNSYVKLLQLEGLSKRMPGELSGGQRQRVSIARAIINSPQILLMDEPFSSLDHNLRIQLGEMLKRLKHQLGLTVVFVTHDIDESLLLADRIAFLHDGKLLEVKPPQQLYYNPSYEETAGFMGEYNTIDVEWRDGAFFSRYGIISAEGSTDDTTRLFVRPNRIQLIKNEDAMYTVDEVMSRGKVTRITLTNEPLIVDSYLKTELKRGDRVDVVF